MPDTVFEGVRHYAGEAKMGKTEVSKILFDIFNSCLSPPN